MISKARWVLLFALGTACGGAGTITTEDDAGDGSDASLGADGLGGDGALNDAAQTDGPQGDAAQGDVTYLDSAVIMGGPGCGFQNAAFCDTFGAPSQGGRGGEISTAWSTSRLAPGLDATSGGRFFPIAAASFRPAKSGVQLPECQPGMAATAHPPLDTRVCGQNPLIGSPHLIVATAAQNYGANSYRIRQPFDFTNRTGTIIFDGETYTPNFLLGWLSIEVTEDPIPTPGFAKASNFEGTPIPKNGFELHFTNPSCANVALFASFNNYVETDIENQNVGACPKAEWGKLNRIEVKVSQNLIEVFATPSSSDGITFGPAVKVFSNTATLPFSRGYVHFTVHNHATEKYVGTYGDGFTTLDAWVARLDNAGFDGPVRSGFREYDVALPVSTPSSGKVDTGWLMPDRTKGTSGVLRIPGVTRAGMTRARLAISAWYCLACGGPAPSTYVVHYRLNGGAWRDRMLTAGEISGLSKGSGAASHMLDVPLTDLIEGDNTIEFASTGIPQNYPPGVTNINLILDDGT